MQAKKWMCFNKIISDTIKLSVENSIIYSLYQDNFINVSCTMNNDNNKY